MTAPIEEEEVVVSLRLQPVVARSDGWQGRSSWLIVAGLAGFIVVGLALGTASDNGRPASSAAVVAPQVSVSPRATRQPTPTPRRLPPLPAVQVIGGEIPTERRLIYANGLQVLDLATGELTTPARPWEDILLSLGDGELVCACMMRRLPTGDAVGARVILRFERLDAAGIAGVDRDVLTFDGVVEVREMDQGFTMAASLSTDKRSLFVLTAVRRPPVWVVELHQVDVSSGDLIGSTHLDELPVDVTDPEPSPSDASPTPRPDGTAPDGFYLWANWLTMSPDGAFATASLAYSEVRGETWRNGSREWMIPLTDGRAAPAIPFTAEAQIGPDAWCLGPPEFVTNDLLVQVCTSADPSRSPSGYIVRRVATDGSSLGTLAIPDSEYQDRYQPAVAVDRTNRAVLTWDPIRHSLARVSIDDGSVVVRDIDPSMLPDVEPPSSRGYFGADPGLVVSADGRRIYALGFGMGPTDSGTSTGIWVFDGENLNLLDRWLPKAVLISIGASADGRFVYAAGANGFDVEGNQTRWPASVTVYDAQTGEIQVIYGQVSRDAWLSFRPLP